MALFHPVALPLGLRYLFVQARSEDRAASTARGFGRLSVLKPHPTQPARMSTPMISAKRLAFAVAAVCAAWLVQSSVGAKPTVDLNVFAASSIGDAIRNVGETFDSRDDSTATLYYNLAGSNALAQQILATNQADVFISADKAWMDTLAKKNRLVAGEPTVLLSNRLVVVAHQTTDWTVTQPEDLATLPFTHLALADPAGVPAGRYAKRFLENVSYEGATLWSHVADKVAPSTNVRATLALVESSPSILGIVYRTDALRSQRVRILYEAPDHLSPPIRYWASRVMRPGRTGEADLFFEFLVSPDARILFERHGFSVPNRGVHTP